MWSQQRAKEVQSREDQMESKVLQQSQSIELLDDGVHKLVSALQSDGSQHVSAANAEINQI